MKIAENRDHTAVLTTGVQQDGFTVPNPGKVLRVLPYVLPVFVVLLAAMAALFIESTTQQVILAPFYVAVIISAWYGGIISGFLATALSALVFCYLILSAAPVVSLSPMEIARIIAFMLVALLISAINEARRQAQQQVGEAYAQLDAIFASAPIGIGLCNRELRFVRLNETMAQMNGLPLEAHLGKTLAELKPGESVVDWLTEKWRHILATGEPMFNVEFQSQPFAAPEKTRHWQANWYPVQIKGQIIGIGSLVQDITERKRSTEARRQQAAVLQEQARLLDLAHNGIMVWDADGTLVYWNRGAEEMYGWAKDEALGRNVRDLLKTELPEPLAQIQDKLQHNENWQGELVHRRRDGARLVMASRWALQANNEGTPGRVLEITTDITELRQAEQAQRLLAEAGQLLAASLDYETTLVNIARLAVPRLADWCGVHIIEGETVRQVAVAHVDPVREEWARDLGRRYPFDPEAPTGVAAVLRTGRSEFYADIPESLLEAAARDEEHRQIIHQLQMRSAMVVPLAARGRTLGAITLVWAESGRRYSKADLALAEELAGRAALAVDNARLFGEAQLELTARRQAEEQLQASLREKEVLIREVHHRVKNNLQAISNLLYLQSNTIKDQRVQEAIRETQNRVKSIALIHEKLYQADNLAEININEYIHNLARHLLTSYLDNPDRVELKIKVDRTDLDIDTAVPLGVIINELVSNALKHAFPAGRNKPDGAADAISIELQTGLEGQLILIVSDNGIGLPEDIDISHSPSLGLQLVQMLSNHMSGLLEFERQAGTTFKITFAPLQKGVDIEDGIG